MDHGTQDQSLYAEFLATVTISKGTVKRCVLEAKVAHNILVTRKTLANNDNICVHFDGASAKANNIMA